MSGNVWEWCWDMSPMYYPVGPLIDYRGATGGFRVMRGGGWDEDAYGSRVAYRGFGGVPYVQYDHIGFRVVRS